MTKIIFCELSPIAEKDLEEISDYIASGNPKRALSFVEEIRKKCEQITLFPKSFQLRPEISAKIRIVAFGRYVICYTDSGDKIRIERILPGERDIIGLFDN
jgi:toxin ParE1/3/4